MRNPNRPGSRSTAAPSRPVTTSAELKARIAQRTAPEARPSLTPGGALETEVHTQVRAANEARIRELRERLEQSRASLNRNHIKARLTGRARTDFDRSR